MQGDRKKMEDATYVCEVMLKLLVNPKQLTWAKAQTLTIDHVEKLNSIRGAIVHLLYDDRTGVSTDGFCARAGELVDQFEKLPIQCLRVDTDKDMAEDLRRVLSGKALDDNYDMSPVHKMQTMHGAFLGTLVDADRLPSERAKMLTTDDIAKIRAARKTSWIGAQWSPSYAATNGRMSEQEYIAMPQAHLELVLAFPWTYFQMNNGGMLDGYRLNMRKMFALETKTDTTK